MNLVESASKKKLQIAVAESLTAGLVSAQLAETPGASKVLLGGVVAYQDQVKSLILGVDSNLIQAQTAVDAEVAMQMALGVRKQFATTCGANIATVVGVSTTGVAGPDPVGAISPGIVFIGISSAHGERYVALQLHGDRSEIRSSAVTAALQAIREEIQLL